MTSAMGGGENGHPQRDCRETVGQGHLAEANTKA